MSNLLCFACGFVTVGGGLSVVLLGCANIFSVAFCFLLFPLFCALCFIVYKRLRPLKFLKIAASVFGVLSASVSVTLAAKLVTDSGVLDGDFYAVLAVLTAVCVLAFGISKRSAVQSTALVSAVICFAVLALTVILSVIDTDFTPLFPSEVSFGDVLPLAFFTFADIALIFPLCRPKSPLPLILGGCSAFVLFVIALSSALSVLSPSLYYSLDMPLLKLWQSTFIASFINRFEVLSVCACYLLIAVKAGIAFWYPAKNSGKKFTPLLTVFMLGGCFLLSFL